MDIEIKMEMSTYLLPTYYWSVMELDIVVPTVG